MSTAFGAPMISPSQDEIWLLSYFKMPKDKMEQERLIFCSVLTVFIIFLILMFWLPYAACRIFPDQGMSLCPLQCSLNCWTTRGVLCSVLGWTDIGKLPELWYLVKRRIQL